MQVEDFNEIVSVYLKKLSKSHKTEIVVESMQENNFGWVYTYNTKEFTNNKDSLNRLFGQGYLVIDKSDGSLNTVDLTIEEEVIGIDVSQKYMKQKYNIPIPNEEKLKLKRRKDATDFYKKLEKRSIINRWVSKISVFLKKI
ncbi:YrhB domain-containing protein [Bernardetia sp. Wsw4-3y2]|uniref:YrhB domain-containing protein n=1 Tax=Bernardetia sp. Wsw4-3y2 TaxID=3127471 RepID=UPI0030D55FC0